MILFTLCFALLWEQATYNRTCCNSERLLQNSAAAFMLLLLLLGGQVVIYDLHNIFTICDLPSPVLFPFLQAEHWTRLMGCDGFGYVRQIVFCGSLLEGCLIHSVSGQHPCF